MSTLNFNSLVINKIGDNINPKLVNIQAHIQLNVGFRVDSDSLVTDDQISSHAKHVLWAYIYGDLASKLDELNSYLFLNAKPEHIEGIQKIIKEIREAIKHPTQ